MMRITASRGPARRLLAWALGLAALVSCQTTAPAPASETTTPTSTTAPTTTAPTTTASTATFSLRVLLTSDEHGWLHPKLDKQASVLRGGVHALAGAMRAEGYSAGAPGWMLLSAGDMWTGPYETTVLEGAPMTATMNHLGYQGAAIGNHEFDFGQRVLAERARGAKFPFLAANLVEANGGAQPQWVKPYTVVNVDDGAGGVARVAVVGLACVDSPVTADVRNMVGLVFQPYASALETWLPKVWADEKPDAVVVIAHDNIAAIRPLTGVLRRHNVHLIAAGHEHRPGIFVDDNGSNAANDDVVICNAGPYLRSFCRVDLEYKDGAFVGHAEKITEVNHATDAPAPAFDAELEGIVQAAEASAARIGGEVLVQNAERLTRGRDGTLGPLLVDAWLEALPYATFAITNAGGLRQDIEAGPLRLRDIVSALPFNNYLLVVDVTGRELKQELLANPETVVGGLRFTYSEDHDGSRRVTSAVANSGDVIDDDTSYKVVINDFMYRGGDRYAFVDREPEETAVDWREPVFRLLRAMQQRGEVLDRKPQPRAVRGAG